MKSCYEYHSRKLYAPAIEKQRKSVIKYGKRGQIVRKMAEKELALSSGTASFGVFVLNLMTVEEGALRFQNSVGSSLMGSGESSSSIDMV